MVYLDTDINFLIIAYFVIKRDFFYVFFYKDKSTAFCSCSVHKRKWIELWWLSQTSNLV